MNSKPLYSEIDSQGRKWFIHKIDQHDGYEVRWVTLKGFGKDQVPVPMAYMNKLFVGDEAFAQQLVKLGIVPELRTPTSTTCSIGFCEHEQRWYGWSHRAMFGFGIGYVVEKHHLVCAEGVPAGFRVETMKDAKMLAGKYAESVS